MSIVFLPQEHLLALIQDGAQLMKEHGLLIEAAIFKTLLPLAQAL